MKKISFITTINHNIGDDFVREGIIWLLNQIGEIKSIELIHKHSPISANYGFEKIRNVRISNLIDPITKFLNFNNRIKNADLIIQSGAPIYWCHDNESHCFETEWYKPLIIDRYLANKRNKKFLNIAGGSCQKYHDGGNCVCKKCIEYIGNLYTAANLTILRDKVASNMLQLSGHSAKVLPCTSIFARDRFNISPEKGEYVVLNFMEYAGHYTFGQSINAKLWRKQFIELATEISKFEKVVIACHTKEEEALANTLVPNLERFIVPNNYYEFIKFYSKAKWGILNRVHGAFILASLGKPSLIIGNDSRAKMIENLNLKSIFVGDVSKHSHEELINQCLSRIGTYPEEIEIIRKNSKIEYINEFRSALIN